jgi:hypothetical protein
MSYLPLHLIKPVYEANVDAGAGSTTTGDDPAKKTEKKSAADRLKEVLSQDEIDALFSDRAKQAGNKALTDLLSALGVKDADELKGKLTKAAELEKAQLTETDRAKAEAAEWKTKAEQAAIDAKAAQDKANETLMRAAVITQAGNFHDPEEAWLLVDKTKITVTDGKVDGAKEAVEAVVKVKPHLVKTGSEGKGTPRSNGKGGGNNKDTTPTYKQSRY